VLFLVIHYTVANLPLSMKILTEGEVSAHYLLSDESPPRIYRLVPEDRRAWHSGPSHWRGHSMLNAGSIGIEIVHPGFRQTPEGRVFAPFPQAQIDALIPLVKDIVRRHGIRPERIVGHSDVLPQHKQDPGPTFPWKRLADEGLIPWPDAARVAAERTRFEAQLPDVEWFQRALKAHGFEVPSTAGSTRPRATWWRRSRCASGPSATTASPTRTPRRCCRCSTNRCGPEARRARPGRCVRPPTGLPRLPVCPVRPVRPVSPPDMPDLPAPPDLRRRRLVAAAGPAAVGAVLPAFAQGTDEPPPAPREFRAAWVATVANIDWPSRPGLDAAVQRAETLAVLDRARELRLNALVLQVRPAGDALYASTLEPWSEYLTGAQGRAPAPPYDPLAFWVEEAHRRGLELHAWFNPYRARHPSAKTPLAPPHLALSRPGS
jgi:N-acetylmuramoyl-L-alanine amidase